ncbi:uncharacterized protein METZ01_LOCUS322949 [marine metagenome]|uniref:Uncharacterized protein n=1 Tax=marine metagenome TaxID=408172 RepID=A0A382PBV2_9ZZZZ
MSDNLHNLQKIVSFLTKFLTFYSIFGISH